MRKAALAGLAFVACGFATNAQFSVTPRVGIEQAFNCVKYNNTSCINPISPNISPQVGLRADYQFNKTHGPFVGIASNRSLVNYEFTNPETGDKEYSSARGDWKLRLEAGYQVSSKPISLGKKAKPTTTNVSTEGLSPCAARRMQALAAVPQKPVMNLRIQPYAGMAFVPNPEEAITTSMQSGETVYQYHAGNYTSAFITGVNLAFAKGSVNKYVIGIQYLKGIGNTHTETLSTTIENKLTTTTLSSSSAAWNINIGIPLTFSKNKQTAAAPAKAVVPVKAETPAKVEAAKPAATAPAKKSCSYYRSRCSHWD
ncbi:hypothetical protein A4H97_14705 [Niastella yeongjuensis]|uniref:Outer membrane protein beta-barrel domain-containing protein n=1 Tax=Niastella yeongjuensis TaxID=354355 RepID=A0A1V9E435_9BACT|nr:hypothetical protein [Niastella yeongjuensis]OQP40856.1 hypothetical protein A4H97_14705 [Niastella yeongjuensis]SEO99679.1 hypothetical protein SAMN05660816_04111 [Niastella yeongjuensis]